MQASIVTHTNFVLIVLINGLNKQVTPAPIANRNLKQFNQKTKKFKLKTKKILKIKISMV